MKLLYLTYGTHSGIVTSHMRALRARGATVTPFDAAAGFDYRMARWKLPSLHPVNVWNVLVALRRYGSEWRWFYRRTDLAFQWMSRKARRHWLVHASEYDAVLQSGVLFHGAPPRTPDRLPYVLHLDHTYALSKHAAPVPGLRSSTPASPAWEAMERRAYQDADAILVMSQCVKHSLIEDYQVDPQKVTVVGGGPNFPEIPATCGRPQASPTILFVGKDFERKGGPVLLDAFRSVRASMPEAQLLVIGPRSIPDTPGVTLLGTLSHEQMVDVYQQARVFVMPSWREPFGIAFIEAMAHGLPCIGTRIEAIPEIIDENRTGLLVEPGHPEQLAASLLQLLSNPQLAADMGAAGYAKVRETLNWEKVAERMADRLGALITAKALTAKQT